MKELPKMYHTKVGKDISSIQKIYSTIGHDRKQDDIGNTRYSNVSIDKKIDDIFQDIGFVYKADVTIVTDNDTFKKRIVARNGNNLITMDNEYIPISIIRDIYK